MYTAAIKGLSINIIIFQNHVIFYKDMQDFEQYSYNKPYIQADILPK